MVLQGTWQGRIECGQMYDNIEDTMSAITKDCDYVKGVEVRMDISMCKASHHDGTHNLELKLFITWIRDGKYTILIGCVVIVEQSLM